MIAKLIDLIGGLVSILGRSLDRLLQTVDKTTLKWLAILVTVTLVTQVMWLTTWVSVWLTLAQVLPI